jgi:hypothetical protein
MIFKNVSEIEYTYNLDFKSDIIEKYNDEIINVFNGNYYYYYNTTDIEIQIILAIYHMIHNNLIIAKQTLLLASINNSNALCTLGIYYKCYEKNDTDAIDCFTRSNNQISIINLAYEYYLMNNINMFLKYNDMIIDENKFIHLSLYELNINNNKDLGLEYIKKACEYNNARAFYIYSNFFSINLIDKINTLFKCIKIKPKKQYINDLKSICSPELRFILSNDCTEYSFYDDTILNTKLLQVINDNHKCPVCLLITNKNIVFKCLHRICFECFIKFKEKCIICLF